MMKNIRPEAITDNTFKIIGKDAMLVTACTTSTDEEGNVKIGRVNTMTASWGGFGVLWNKNVATIYIRPSRYTKEILDQTDFFSLSFFDEKYKTALDYCGKHSGRDGDKFRPAKLDLEYNNYVPWIRQARMVVFCRKLYAQPFDPYSFTDELICKQNYRKDDFHTMYIGEITKVTVSQKK